MPPTADGPWFAWETVAPGVTRLWEPYVHVLMRANVFLVAGRDRDLVVDAGMGVQPLRPVLDGLRANPGKPLDLFITHAHIDHFGGAHEFDTRLAHRLEADELSAPAMMTSLRRADVPETLRQVFVDSGYPPLGETMLEALPHDGYEPGAYRLPPAPPTAYVAEGDTIDLGDRRFTVLHLPGHAPGQVGLHEPATGTLFGADAIYDGPLVHAAPGMSTADYAATLRRLRELDVTVVHGGHEPIFGPARLRELIDHYLASWADAAQAGPGG
jgi:glyoxylase-like metal-dependent hydrolase (beta-lactamase superfamily II)